MAEFCLECWNRINETNDSESKYIISKDLDLCEGCGKRTHVIVVQRKYYCHKFRLVIFVLWRILIMSYLFWQYKKAKK